MNVGLLTQNYTQETFCIQIILMREKAPNNKPNSKFSPLNTQASGLERPFRRHACVHRRALT